MIIYSTWGRLGREWPSRDARGKRTAKGIGTVPWQTSGWQIVAILATVREKTNHNCEPSSWDKSLDFGIGHLSRSFRNNWQQHRLLILIWHVALKRGSPSWASPEQVACTSNLGSWISQWLEAPYEIGEIGDCQPRQKGTLVFSRGEHKCVNNWLH